MGFDSGMGVGTWKILFGITFILRTGPGITRRAEDTALDEPVLGMGQGGPIIGDDGQALGLQGLTIGRFIGLGLIRVEPEAPERLAAREIVAAPPPAAWAERLLGAAGRRLVAAPEEAIRVRGRVTSRLPK